MTKNLGLDKKDQRTKLDQNTDLHQWQLAHIKKGVEAAKKADFASDKEIDDFFNKYGRLS